VIEMSNSSESTTLPKDVDVCVIGAGAGLAASASLTQAGREHRVIDRRDRLDGGWQDRWDSFGLVPGLYSLGLLWQHSQASTSLVGPALDGPHVVGAPNRDASRRPCLTRVTPDKLAA
jgi:glycine/D-amino acid oxidase-like deaminating enzyme